MILSKETVDILKNFASINPGLSCKGNSTISTISSARTVLAKAVLPEDFSQKFAIYDLNEDRKSTRLNSSH